MKIANNITELIGNTPLVYLNRITKDCKAKIAVKLECFNPANSVKDRISISMVEEAEKQGLIKPGKTTLIEPTSGNTGIGLALVAAVKGYKLILTMPESMSAERRMLIRAYGSEFILTPAELGMRGAVEKAQELSEQINDSYVLYQFKNPANPKIHLNTTAEEIWNDTDGKVDIIVAGIGTGGTITGIARNFKEKNKDIKIIGVEPLSSSVISGGKPGPHKIQGIGAGFIPDVLDVSLLGEVFCVTDDDAISTARELSSKEGILSGISCGAAAFAAIQTAKREENKDKLIISILPDYGERYLSTFLYQELMKSSEK